MKYKQSGLFYVSVILVIISVVLIVVGGIMAGFVGSTEYDLLPLTCVMFVLGFLGVFSFTIVACISYESKSYRRTYYNLWI